MTFLEDTLIILISQIVFFVGGWIFFVKQLFRDYEVHHLLVQLIFSVTFALSCTMFELIIFEIIDYLDSRLSIAIQRGNAASLLGTLPGDSDEEQFFDALY